MSGYNFWHILLPVLQLATVLYRGIDESHGCDKQTDGQTDGQTDRPLQTDRQADRHTDRKTDTTSQLPVRQTDRQADSGVSISKIALNGQPNGAEVVCP